MCVYVHDILGLTMMVISLYCTCTVKLYNFMPNETKAGLKYNFQLVALVGLDDLRTFQLKELDFA